MLEGYMTVRHGVVQHGEAGGAGQQWQVFEHGVSYADRVEVGEERQRRQVDAHEQTARNQWRS